MGISNSTDRPRQSGTDTATGVSALQDNTTGFYNTADGAGVLGLNTTGIDNTASGVAALSANTTGEFNTASGAFALYNNTSGWYNTAVGASADFNGITTTGSWNTYVGYLTNSGTLTNLNNATAIGANAQVLASNSMVLGSINGVNRATASTNVGIGTTIPMSTLDVDGGLIHVGGTTTPYTLVQGAYVGWNALTGSTGETDLINNQGGGSGGFAFMNTPSSGSPRTTLMYIAGYGNVGIGTTSPDTLLSVNGGADKPGGGSWGSYSDRRLKRLAGSFNSGLSQILKINPVRYRYKEDNAMGIRDTDEHVGLVVQEVQKVIPEAVTKNSKGYLLVNNDPIIWAILNAMKEQQSQALKKDATIRHLQAQIKADRLAAKAQIAQLAAQVKMVQVALASSGQPIMATRTVSAQLASLR